MTNDANGSCFDPFLFMRKDTYKVSIAEVFVENRLKVVRRLQESGVPNGVIYLRGGPVPTRFDTDHEPIFRQESYFWYLSGVKEPDCSLAISVASGEMTLFIPRLPESYATIMGKIRTPSEWKTLYQANEVKFVDEVEGFLLNHVNKEEQDKTATNTPHILLLQGPNSDSGITYEPPTFENAALSAFENHSILFPILADCRVIKSEAECLLVQHATEVSSFAHVYVMRNIQSGMMEYQAESLFRHYCYFNYGCRLVGYTPICGCGPNAAVLHYGHAGEPNDRQSASGDMCLFDMGAEYFGYGSDVTCSFPIDGTFTKRQRAVYSAVLKAQVAVYDMIEPGVCWVKCHKAAEREILRGLIDLDVVDPFGKTLDDLVEMRLGAVFMPHGLGHLIGIDTHDVGGYLPQYPARSTEPGLKSLRTARCLEEGMLLTVEPGCYFIDHLLDEALQETSPLNVHLNADAVNDFRGFGGVRLEDVVRVTASGCVNFTLCPRTLEEVEGVLNGHLKWPPASDTAPELRRVRLTEMSPLPSPPSK